MKSPSYWTVTNTPLYSFIFTLALLLIYEVGLFAISANDLPLLRNGADVLMRQFLEMFGIAGTYGFGGTFLIGFMIAFLNPKILVFLVAVFSQFLKIDINNSDRFFMDIIAGAIDTMWYVFVDAVLAGTTIVDKLRENAFIIDGLIGMVLFTLAILLIVKTLGTDMP